MIIMFHSIKNRVIWQSALHVGFWAGLGYLFSVQCTPVFARIVPNNTSSRAEYSREQLLYGQRYILVRGRALENLLVGHQLRSGPSLTMRFYPNHSAQIKADYSDTNRSYAFAPSGVCIGTAVPSIPARSEACFAFYVAKDGSVLRMDSYGGILRMNRTSLNE